MSTVHFLVPSFSLLLLMLLFNPTLSVDPLKTTCFVSKNFTIQGFSPKDLGRLTRALVSVISETGYATASLNSEIWALAQCRGDVKGSPCQSCISEASNQMKKACSKGNMGIIWYDDCLLKVSEGDFLGQIDSFNSFIWSGAMVSNNPDYFNLQLNQLVRSLTYNASSSSDLFATGEVTLQTGDTIYGMTQCTQDLSRDDCNKCLRGIINQLPQCCSAKEAGGVMEGSCTIRYALNNPF